MAGSATSEGISPRARGQPAIRTLVAWHVRNIPACTGTTESFRPPITLPMEYPRVYGFTQGSPPHMWRHLLQFLGVPRFPSAGRCTHIGIADHPPRLQTPAAQLTSGAGIRGNAFSHRFGRLDDPKTPEIAQTAMRARIRGVYGDSVGRSDRRFCNLRLAYRGQRDPPSPIPADVSTQPRHAPSFNPDVGKGLR